MRRVVATIALGAALVGLGACAEGTTADPWNALATEASHPDDGARAARATACGTVKAAREELFTPFLLAVETLSDANASAADVKEATDSLRTALTTLSAEMKKAGDQTQDAALVASLTQFAGAIDAAAAEVKAAGGDRTKIVAAAETDAFKNTERAILDLCFDVWNP